MKWTLWAVVFIALTLIRFPAVQASRTLSSNTSNGHRLRRLMINDPEDVDIEIEPVHYKRTATGGVINTVLTILTMIAFFGNLSFAVYVFWLSR